MLPPAQEQFGLKKRTPKVRFQGPAMGPAGAEDVTDLLGKRHGYGGHGFAGAVVPAVWKRAGFAVGFAPAPGMSAFGGNADSLPHL